jgi:hypothetical protein
LKRIENISIVKCVAPEAENNKKSELKHPSLNFFA